MSIAIELEPTIEQRLDDLSARSGRTKADYLREAIARGLEDIEDLEEPMPLTSVCDTERTIRRYWRYRVGDRRFCDLQDGHLVESVLEVGNRRDVYR